MATKMLIDSKNQFWTVEPWPSVRLVKIIHVQPNTTSFRLGSIIFSVIVYRSQIDSGYMFASGSVQ